MVRPGSLAPTATPASGIARAERSGAERGTCSRPPKKSSRPATFAIAPLAPLLAAAAIGIVADRWLLELTTTTWVKISLPLAVIAIVAVGHTRVYCMALLAATAAIAAGWHHHRWSDMAADDLARSALETPRPVWARGVVTEARGLRHQREGFGFGKGDDSNVTTRFVVDITSISDGRNWSKASGRTNAIVTGELPLIRAGQAIEAAGQITTIAPPLNPGEFDYRAFLQAQGIRLRVTVENPENFRLDPTGIDWPFKLWLDRHRYRIRSWLFKQLDPSTAPLASALLLGWREEIDPEINDAFARTGTTHLLAVSGLQLQALAAALLLIFRAIGFPRRTSYVIVGSTMIVYALLVGLAPSVVRSTVMTTTFCSAAIAQRRARPANTLSLAALLTLGINPMYLFDVGCQLSFLAIGALVWLVLPACALVRTILATIRARFLGPRSALDDLERLFEPAWRKALRRVGNRMFEGVVASAVVWLAALPLVAFRFHLVSPIGILLNIPLIPLTSAAMLLGGISLVLSMAWGPLGWPLAWAAGLSLSLTQRVVVWGVAQPYGHRFVVGPSCGWVLVFYVLLAMATLAATKIVRNPRPDLARWFNRKGVWWLVAGWIMPGWLLAGVGTGDATLEAEFLAVGHGLAVLIQTPDGQTLLYDCGRMGDPTVGRRVIAPALWARGVSHVDTVFLSHADQDHFDGLPDLLDRFPIGEVRLPPGFSGADNPMATRLIELLRARGVPVRPITAPKSWEKGAVQFTLSHPPAGWHPETSDNARSLVLDIAYRGRHLLLTGDLEKLGLEQMVDRPPPEPPPDVFLAPHHGGKTANPEWLYRWAKPRTVVVSQRPVAAKAGDALAPLERRGIPILRTWRRGAIRLRWTDDAIATSGFLDDQENAPEMTRREQSGPAVPLSGNDFVADHRASRGMRLLIGCMGFGLGAIVCGALAVIEFAAWVLIAPPRSIRSGAFGAAASQTSRQDCPGEPIELRAPDGALLAGRWLPAPGPLVTGRTTLLLHGFAEASSALEARRAAALNRHGWNVAVLDSRGYGRSGGPFPTFGAREAGDIAAWLEFLSRRIAGIDPDVTFKPVLWGRSMGAGIAVRTAATNPGLAAIVLESPMVDLNVSMTHVLRRRKIPLPNLIAGLVTRRAGELAGVPIHFPAPVQSVRHVTCPTLILHGTNDTVVSIDEARRLANAFPAPPYWIEVPDARHTDVVDKGGEVLLDRVAEFLDEAASSAVPTRVDTREAS